MILERNYHFAFIDTASSFYFPMIKRYLEKNRVYFIDFILLTHFHSDHYGNIINIIESYPVKKLYIKKYRSYEKDMSPRFPSEIDYHLNELENYLNIINVATSHNVEIIYLDKISNDSKYVINFCDIPLYLYNTNNNINEIYENINSPYYHVRKFGENSNSIITYIKYNGHTALLASDIMNIPSDVESMNMQAETIVKNIFEEHNISNFDLYKTSHHGAGSTNRYELLELIKCNISVITNTSKWLNEWTTLNNLKRANKNVDILTTDNFQYVIDFSKNDIVINKITNESLFLILNKD